MPSPANPPSGCYFHTRCKYAQQKCTDETPELREIPQAQGGSEAGAVRPRMVACHFAESLELTGALVPSPEAFRAVETRETDAGTTDEPDDAEHSDAAPNSRREETR